MSKQDQYARRTCDIVMKGGITSGVVYPKAIITLAKRFTFENVGGTSAGAIAAAAAAAAEYRRTKTGSDDGFGIIGKLGEFLAEKPAQSSDTRLFSLFRPNGSTRRLFTVLTSALGGGKSAGFAFLIRAVELYVGAALLGAAPGFALMVFSLFRLDAGALAWVSALVGIVAGIVGGVIAVAVSFAREFVSEVPRNNFGLCSGMPDSDVTAKLPAEPLTTWLTQYLNEVAGFELGHRPLIFGDLWNPNNNPNQGAARYVNLEMMATNLTHGRPYRLPFRDDEDLHENYLFYFRQDEFRRLFPATVVDWMISNPRPIRETNPDKLIERQNERDERKKAGYFPMPAPENLPVVVVTRMSLSFPVLLSAIPLHSIDRKKPKEHQTIERCWFTDGGLCSNLPLHFFDSPLPRRPTFSIDLTEKPDDTPDDELVPEMDNDNGGEPMDRWNRFDKIVFSDLNKTPLEKSDWGKLTGFVWTMIATMQNWNDATVSRLPGYRDRIVRIPLTSKQGGLNLNMPPELVKFLTDQGGQCAKVLMEHFDVPAIHSKMTWENHRWIRIRSMMASLEKMVEQTLTTCENPENDASYEEWLNELIDDTTGEYKELSFKPTKAQLKAAIATLEQLRALRSIWDHAGSAAEGAPRPRPSLRPRPQI